MTQSTTATTPRGGWTAGEIGAAAAIYVSVFMAMLDVSVVVLAVPAIQTDLAASPAVGQWMMAVYTLCLSMVAVSIGSLGDRYGRRRVFLLGVALFTLGSALCAAAISPAWVIGGRVVQGVGAAAVLPGSMSLIAQTFPDPARRGRLLAGWSTIAGIAAVSGPAVGGLLVDGLGWPSIFLLNLPFGLVALVLGRRCLPESADPAQAGLDPAGQVLGIVWLGALSFGLIYAGDHGWTSPVTLVSLVVAAVVLPVFVWVESRQPRPMLPLGLFRDGRVTLPVLAAFAFGFGQLSLGVFLSTFLQEALHLSATAAGLVMLPAAAVAILVPFATGRLLTVVGARPLVVVGTLVTVAGLAVLLLAGPGRSGLLVTATLAVTGIGYSLAAPATNAGVFAAIDRTRTGTISAVVNSIRHTGTTLGIAVLGAVIAGSLADPAGGSRESALTDGVHTLALTAGGVLLVVAVLVALGPRWATGETS